MSKNSIPTNTGQFIGLANKMLAGLTSLGSTLAITQITPAALQALLSAFIATDGDFNAARSAKQAASTGFQAAEEALSAWLAMVRNVLAARFGGRWSTEWAQAGFTDATTSVPKRIEDRLALTLRLAGFFTANPSFQLPTIDVTAAKANALYTAALTTQQLAIDSGVAQKTAGDLDDAARLKLEDAMWSLIRLLDATIADNDPRWLSFGLNMPSADTTPGQPLNVTAHADDTGAMVVQCDAVPLATRYRWRMLVVDVDKDYALAASTTEPMANISGVEPGKLVKLIVQAVNGKQQGVASEPLLFRIPQAQSSAPKRSVEVHASAGQDDSPAPGNGLGLSHRMLPRGG